MIIRLIYYVVLDLTRSYRAYLSVRPSVCPFVRPDDNSSKNEFRGMKLGTYLEKGKTKTKFVGQQN